MARLQTDNPQLSTLLITWNLLLVRQQLLGVEGKKGGWVRKSYVLLMGQSVEISSLKLHSVTYIDNHITFAIRGR